MNRFSSIRATTPMKTFVENYKGLYLGKVSRITNNASIRGFTELDDRFTLPVGANIILCDAYTANDHIDVLLALPGDLSKWLDEFSIPTDSKGGPYNFIVSKVLFGAQVLYIWDDVDFNNNANGTNMVLELCEI